MTPIQYTGALIDKPGVYDIPIEAYHGQPCAGPSISSSGLRTIWSESPAHYWAKSSLNPDREPEEFNEALALGKAAHHLLLGESHFRDHFAIRPEMYKDYRSGEARSWKESVIKEGRVPLTDAMMKAVHGMHRSLSKHPVVQAGILNGEIEKSLIWQDEETGIWLKVRPDAIPNDSGDYSDLKTTTNVTRRAIENTIKDFGYQMQGALIGMAAEAVLGVPMQSFSLVMVEKTSPYCVRVVSLKDDDLKRGVRQIRIALQMFADCLKTGEWYGPGGTQSDAEFIALAPWAAKDIDEKCDLLQKGIMT